MRNIKNYYKAFVYFMILTISVILLSTCGGGGGGGDSSSSGTAQEIIAAEVIVSSTDINPIAVATNKDASETMVVAGKRNSNGNISSVEGVSYVLSENNYLTLVINKATGLPDYFIDSNGNRYVFQNFTTDSATLSIYNPQGRLAWGPSTVKLNASNLSDIKNKWNTINSQLRDSLYLSNPETLSDNPFVLTLQIGSLLFDGFMCYSSVATAIATSGVAIPLAVWRCGSLAINAWATFSDSDLAKNLGISITGANCAYAVATSDPLKIFGCGLSFSKILAAQIFSPPSTIANLNGVWSGPYILTLLSGSSQSYVLNCSLTQSGTTVAGSWQSTAGSVGTLSGTVNGNTAQIIASQTNPTCTGTLNINATVNGNTFTFTGNGSTTCQGAITITSGSLVKN